jgi:hypothetical protein
VLQEEAVAKFGADPRTYLTTVKKFVGDAVGRLEALVTMQVRWERNDKVAKELGVSPDRVSEVLKPALDQGFIERQVITVWNQEKHRVDRITGWREVVKTVGKKV